MKAQNNLRENKYYLPLSVFFCYYIKKKKIEAKYVNDSYLNTNKMTYLDKLHETFFLLEE